MIMPTVTIATSTKPVQGGERFVWWDRGGHVLIDYVTASPTGSSIVEAASSAPLAAALDAESSKRVTYGPLKPHELIPFAIEDCGGLGPDALALVRVKLS